MLIVVLFVFFPAASARAASLALGSATGYAGETVSLNLTLSDSTVSGLQWTLTYSQTDITAVEFAISASAANAGKSLYCNATPGKVTCLIVGLNATTISQGVVAVVQVALAAATAETPSSRTVALNLTNPVGASPAGDPVIVTTGSGSVTILRPAPTQVTPATTSMFAQQTQQFSTDTSVVWSLSPAVGTITSAGLYTAPSLVSSQQQVTVTATNASNSSYFATATVQLYPVSVGVSPSSASLTAYGTQQFSATVTDSPDSSVTWSLTPSVGSISSSGRYTAPSSIASSQTVTVTATSVFDPSKSASALVHLQPQGGGGTGPVYITLEAESGTVTSPMTIEADSQASGGYYVVSSSSRSGDVSLDFNVPANGVYVVWCRTISPNNGQDSFYVRMDGGSEITYDTAPGTWSPDWQWTSVDGFTLREFELTAGSHVIRFRSRERYTKLDQVLITDDSDFVPTGIPGSRTPTAVFRATDGSIRLIRHGDSTIYNSGGIFASDPGAAQNAAGDTFAVARDTAGAIWANVFNASSLTWGSWSPGGGVTVGVPAVAVTSDGTAYIAIRDPWDSYWLTSFTITNGFTGWTYLGGTFSVDPVMAASPDGSVFIVGKDKWNAILSGHYVPGTGFGGWQAGGGIVKGKPSITCGTDGVAYIAIRDMWNSLWIARVDRDNWLGWSYGGGVISADPVIASAGDTQLYIAVMDTGNGVWLINYKEGSSSDGWGTWTFTKGILQHHSIAAENGNVYITGLDGGDQLWWYASSSSEWRPVPDSQGVATGSVTSGPK